MKAQKFPVNTMVKEFKRMLMKAQSLPGFEPILVNLNVKLSIKFDEKSDVQAVHTLKMKGIV